MRRLLLGLLLLAAPAAAAPPKLMIVISIDQLSADLFDQYRPGFTGGFSRLGQGAVFRNGYQSHAATETCPGHSTILTGRRPSRTGIVANSWFDPQTARADKTIYCAEDEAAPGTSSTAYRVSPVHLHGDTLGDLLKRASPGSRNVAIAGKDRAAVMMGGVSADQRWYWDGSRFVTYGTGATPPRSVTATNAAVATAIASAADGPEITPACASKAQVYTVAGGGRPVGAGTLARAAGDRTAFRATPQFDAAVLALAAGLIQEMKLGSGSASDLLSIGLSATDYVGHTYGPGGQEMCLQLSSLDRDLGDFMALLDRWGVDYAVALTADHGSLDIPERLRAHGIADAAWMDSSLAPKVIGAKAAGAIGRSGSLITEGGPSGDIYLDPALVGAERVKAIAALVSAYRAHPQVEAVFTRSEIAAAPAPSGDPANWSLITRVRANFDPARSGDLTVVLKPHIQPIADTRQYVATHGSPWDYDRRVPILMWRPGMAAANRADAIETVDIMPTLAALMGVPLDQRTVDGHCLAGIAAIACPAR